MVYFNTTGLCVGGCSIELATCRDSLKHYQSCLCTLRFRIKGGAGIIGGLETSVDINNRGGWNNRGVETSIDINNRGVGTIGGVGNFEEKTTSILYLL